MKFSSFITNKIFSKFLDDDNIVWLDTNKVLTMSAPDPTFLSQDEYKKLWEELNKNGMNTPLIVTISDETEMARLDSGNHRIKLFSLNGIKKVPCKIEYVQNHVNRTDNGMHYGIPVIQLGL